MKPRTKTIALGVAGVAAGAAGVAAYRAARKYRNLELDMSELALAEDLEPVAVTVDDGVTIRGVEGGSGRPILLLHGVTLSAATWPFQLKALSKEYRVIALDARGHGKSVTDVMGWDMPRMARDVAQVVEQLDLRDLVIVGHSMGGMMTQQFCVDFPEVARDRVAGTILLSTSPSPGERIPGYTRFGPKTSRRPVIRRQWTPPGEITYAIARLALGAHPDPRFVAHTRDLAAALTPEVMASVLPHVVGFEIRKRLKDYPVPALVITGSRDLLTPPRTGRELARLIPGAQFELLPGAGHMPMLERADWLNERIDRFARDLS